MATHPPQLFLFFAVLFVTQALVMKYGAATFVAAAPPLVASLSLK